MPASHGDRLGSTVVDLVTDHPGVTAEGVDLDGQDLGSGHRSVVLEAPFGIGQVGQPVKISEPAQGPMKFGLSDPATIPTSTHDPPNRP